MEGESKYTPETQVDSPRGMVTVNRRLGQDKGNMTLYEVTEIIRNQEIKKILLQIHIDNLNR